MVPSPPLWAVLGDVLLCLGAGLLLGAVRDGATLALWQRPGALLCVGCAGLCCRSLCLLRLRGGGFGYRGGALVYGRRHGAGGTMLAVVRFQRGAQGAARHGVCSGLAAALCGGPCGTPVQTVAAGPDQKGSARPVAQRTRFMQEKRKKAEKCVAKQAHNII